MSNKNNIYSKNRYKSGLITYILMFLIAIIFLSLGTTMIILIIINLAPVGLIMGIPCMGFGIIFAFYSIKTLLRMIISVRLVDTGKSGIGRVVRIKGAKFNNAYMKYAIVFKYVNDRGVEKLCTTNYVFYQDEIIGLDNGYKITIKYNKHFAIVDGLFKTLDQANALLKPHGEEYLSNRREYAITVSPKTNKFLNISKFLTIGLFVLLILSIIVSIVTNTMVFLYIGIALFLGWLILFGIIFAIHIFGKNKKR